MPLRERLRIFVQGVILVEVVVNLGMAMVLWLQGRFDGLSGPELLLLVGRAEFAILVLAVIGAGLRAVLTKSGERGPLDPVPLKRPE